MTVNRATLNLHATGKNWLQEKQPNQAALVIDLNIGNYLLDLTLAMNFDILHCLSLKAHHDWHLEPPTGCQMLVLTHYSCHPRLFSQQ